jgi:hypothetical protein
MTLADQDVPVIAWNESDGLIARGTVIVIPGRGELPTVYERFGRRLAADAYRVRAVADPVVDAELARAQISGLLADSSLPAPQVLAELDTGALSRSCWPDQVWGRPWTHCSWPACPPDRRLVRRARWGRFVTGMLRLPRLNWSASQPAGTMCSTTRPTGRWPPASCCSWNGSGRTLARARLRSRSSWDDDERALRRR